MADKEDKEVETVFTVGLTGDVGAGKSTVVRVWRALGANTIDADAIAKEEWHKPEIARLMTARWGDRVLTDGHPDYAKIAAVAFSNEEEYRFTNALIHPGTRAEISRRANALRGWIVAEIPLLFEAGRHDWIDCVVCVAAPRERRVAQNAFRGWDDDEIRRRERFLIDGEEKRRMSEVVMTNNGTLEAWREQAEARGKLFRRMSGVCELSTHCASLAEAETIAEKLVQNRFAACVNIGEERSVYAWKGATCRDAEWSLRAKTTQSARREAMHCIREMHSYELPAIVATEIAHADFETLKWVAENCI